MGQMGQEMGHLGQEYGSRIFGHSSSDSRLGAYPGRRRTIPAANSLAVIRYSRIANNPRQLLTGTLNAA
jgi:hypothetical protein